MSQFNSRFWRPLITAVLSVTATVALADQPGPSSPTPASTADIRQALIFTGNYSALEPGHPSALLRRASQGWQTTKAHKLTDTLPAEEVSALLLEGQKRRYALGWTMLRDKSVDFEIGVPTKLVKFVSAQAANNTAIVYKFEGDSDLRVSVRYGDYHCGKMNAYYSWSLKTYGATQAVAGDNWYAIAWSEKDRVHFVKAICTSSAVVFAYLTLCDEQMELQDVLFAAMTDSFNLGPRFNPTAPPHPVLDDLPPLPEGYQDSDGVIEAKPKELPANVDGLGKASTVKPVGRSAAELRAEQVFQQAGAAVYVVKVRLGIGSAVAISDTELLTNCHVVGDQTQVTLFRDKKELSAKLVSAFTKGDRCVLRVDEKLPAWVRVRSYDSITVGERAFSIGTPKGLELTIAEGIVSSKRVIQDFRYIQTSAPVSPGSSGGGLFDAQGQLLGVTTFGVLRAQNLNFAIAGEEYAK